MKPISILLVDDNQDDILLVQEAFDDALLANVVHTVFDGEQAMAFLRHEPPYEQFELPGLVLLDINLPKKNGLIVLQEIKQDDVLKRLPVIILTTSNRDEDVIASYAGGACTYIQKPVDFDKMRQIAKDFSLYWALVAKLPSQG